MCKLIGRKSAPRKSEFNTQREKKVAALTSNDLFGASFIVFSTFDRQRQVFQAHEDLIPSLVSW